MKDYIKIWKDLAHEKRITSQDIYQRCLLKAVAAKSQEKEVIALYFLRKAFTPITRKSKLKALKPYNGLFRASYCPTPGSLIGQPLVATKLLDCIETEEELALFNRLNRTIVKLVDESVDEVYKKIEEESKKLYSFVFVRQDISIEQQMVQSIHAGIKLGKQVDDSDTLNVVLCGADNQDHLKKINLVIECDPYNPIKTVHFYEPDINNEFTSFATIPLTIRQKRRLRNYKPLTVSH